MEVTDKAEWEWLESEPNDWRPQVIEDGDRVIVTFLTISGLGRECLYRHGDVYFAGSYNFDSDRTELAVGPGGFVF